MGFSTGFGTAFGAFSKMTSAYHDSYFDQVEKERENKRANDKIKQDKIDAANKLTEKRTEDGFKATENLRKAFDDINAQIEDVKSSDWKGTEDERISRVNELQSQKLGAYKTAAANTSSIGFDLTKDGQFELGANDISQLMKIKSGDKTLIADKGLIQGIKDSNGQYVIDGNEIKSRKLEWSNSQGKMIPVEDKDGNYIYEPTGETLSEYSDVFSTTDSDSTKSTKYTMRRVGDLPRPQKEAFIAKGFNEDEMVRNADIDDIMDSPKPENLTEKEARVANEMERESFKRQYGDLPEADQKVIAFEAVTERPTTYAENLIYQADRFSAAISEDADPVKYYDDLGQRDKASLIGGLSKKEAGKDFNKNYATAARSLITQTEINKSIQDLKPEDVNAGITGAIKQTVLEMTPERWSNLGEAERNKMMNTIRAQGTLGSLMFKVLNTENKGAPSDRDFAFIRGLVMGDQFDNITTIKEKFNTFTNKRIIDLKDTFNANPTFKVLQLTKSRKNLETVMNLETSTSIKKETKSSTQVKSDLDKMSVTMEGKKYTGSEAMKRLDNKDESKNWTYKKKLDFLKYLEGRKQ
jgi:hypothetical protein